MDSINDVYEQSLNELEKVDKVGNAIELAATILLSAGTSFVLKKGMDKVYKPEKIVEKVLMWVGNVAISSAIGYCAGQTVHCATHPLEQRKRQEITNKTLVLAQKQLELSQATIEVANAAHEEANLLLQAVYIPDDIPDNGLTMEDLKKDIDVSVEDEDGE